MRPKVCLIRHWYSRHRKELHKAPVLGGCVFKNLLRQLLFLTFVFLAAWGGSRAGSQGKSAFAVFHRFHWQLQVSRWPWLSRETRPPSRRCSRGTLSHACPTEFGNPVQQGEESLVSLAFVLFLSQVGPNMASCVQLSFTIPALCVFRTSRPGWPSTSRPCSGARPSCTGTLAKAHSDEGQRNTARCKQIPDHER